MSESPDRKRVRKRKGAGSFGNLQQRDTSLLGILRTEPKFRWALAGLVLLGLFIGGMLPKIWITSPEGFDPVVKVSGLDLIQARSLRHSAVRHADNGEVSEAMSAWHSAIANNMGDPDSFRGILRYGLGVDHLEQRWVLPMLQQAGWLMRLSKTNQADLELACAVYQRNELHETVARLLSDTNRVLSVQGNAILARSLFESGRMAEFGELWKKSGDQLQVNPDMQVLRAAWGAGWGPAVGMQAAAKALADATTKPDLATNALRLQLAVQAQRMDTAGVDDTFQRLQSLRADRLTDHVRYWLLLDFLGRRQQAIDRARNFVTQPQTASEAEVLLRAWSRLGQYDLAVDFGTKQMANYPNATQLWLLLSRMLVAAQKWDEVRSVAVEIRNNHRMSRILGGYTYYLEGVAEHGAGFSSRAEAAFRSLLRQPPDDPMLTFEAASEIQRLGYAEPARELYRTLEKTMGDKLVFWQQMAKAAHDTHETALLVAACEKAHQIEPNNLVLANNHAAALLITRSNATEAVKLTMAVLSKAPESSIARINHALALAQMARYDDAEAELGKLQITSLDEQEQTFYHFALLDCDAGRGRLEEARKEIELVELRYLFPPQIEWMTQMRVRLAPKSE